MRAWQERRDEFNHDWLSRFLVRLGAFIDRLEDAPMDVERVTEFLREDLPAWAAKRSDAVQLVDTFAEEMSPRSLLEGSCGLSLDPETRLWLPDLVHRLWLRRYPVREWVAEAKSAMRSTDEMHDHISRAMAGIDSETGMVGSADASEFAELRERFRRLQRAFSAFPHAVRVT
jgi:hypothetical protein